MAGGEVPAGITLGITRPVTLVQLAERFDTSRGPPAQLNDPARRTRSYSGRRQAHASAHSSDSTSACSSTVLDGGSPFRSSSYLGTPDRDRETTLIADCAAPGVRPVNTHLGAARPSERRNMIRLKHIQRQDARSMIEASAPRNLSFRPPKHIKQSAQYAVSTPKP